MESRKEVMKRGMVDKIRKVGTWFCTRKDKYVKIGFSEPDDSYFARECFLADGGLQGGAYSFGTDWFDISFHGKYIDIYADPDTFKVWPVSYSSERGTHFEKSDERDARAERMLEFCKQADAEALAGITDPYHINGTNFEHLRNTKEE